MNQYPIDISFTRFIPVPLHLWFPWLRQTGPFNSCIRCQSHLGFTNLDFGTIKQTAYLFWRGGGYLLWDHQLFRGRWNSLNTIMILRILIWQKPQLTCWGHPSLIPRNHLKSRSIGLKSLLAVFFLQNNWVSQQCTQLTPVASGEEEKHPLAIT